MVSIASNHPPPSLCAHRDGYDTSRAAANARRDGTQYGKDGANMVMPHIEMNLDFTPSARSLMLSFAISPNFSFGHDAMQTLQLVKLVETEVRLLILPRLAMLLLDADDVREWRVRGSPLRED
jgi:hypothetical protein